MPDEPLVLKEALKFGKTLNIGEVVKSAPHMYINFFFSSVYYVVQKLRGVLSSPMDMTIIFVRDPSHLYFLLRSVSAFLSTISIFLISIFVYKIFKCKEAFFWSAILYTILPASLKMARTMKEDNTAILLFLSALIYLYSLYEKGGWKRFFIAGCMSGVAVAAKGYSAFLYPLLLYMWWRKGESWKVLIACAFGVIISNSIINPYPYFNFGGNISLTFLGPLISIFILILRKHEGAIFKEAAFYGTFTGRIGEGLHDIRGAIEGATGWFFIILSILSFFYTLLKKEEKFSPSIIFIILYSIALILYVQGAPSYLLPIIPFLLIVTFHLLFEIKKYYRYILLYLISFSFLFISVKKILIPGIIGVPAEKLALEWIRNNVKPRERLLIHPSILQYMLPETKKSVMRAFEEYKKIVPYPVEGTTFSIRLKFADEMGYELYRLYTFESLGFVKGKVDISVIENIKEKFDYVILPIHDKNILKKWERIGMKWEKNIYTELINNLKVVAKFPEGITVMGPGVIICKTK